jgi:menaquinol-cytochrome c reductase iron-sulfur subunit
MSSGEANKKPAAAEPSEEQGLERRQMLSKLGAGVVGAAVGLPVLMSVRSLVPNALYEMPLRFKAGKLEMFAEGPTFIADQRVFIFRESQTFYCLSGVCTHLGCTVQIVRSGTSGVMTEDYEFHCPCHGSKFQGDGTNVEGPAPRPLDYFQLELAPDDGQLIVDLSKVADKGWRFSV